MVSLGTDPWQQHITPILEGSEDIRQTARNVSGTAALTLGWGRRAEDLQTSLSGEPAGHLGGLELGVS